MQKQHRIHTPFGNTCKNADDDDLNFKRVQLAWFVRVQKLCVFIKVMWFVRVQKICISIKKALKLLTHPEQKAYFLYA